LFSSVCQQSYPKKCSKQQPALKHAICTVKAMPEFGEKLFLYVFSLFYLASLKSGNVLQFVALKQLANFTWVEYSPWL